MKHPTPKADRLREMREETAARGTRSLVHPRLMPSVAVIKRAADRAEKPKGRGLTGR